MSDTVQLQDRTFVKFISHEEIQAAVQKVADRINTDYRDKNPLILAVLNGSFMFAADLMKKITVTCEISFVKLASYHGVSSSGTVHEMIGMAENPEGRDIIILEDIVDTGLTIEKVVRVISHKNAATVKIATLLLKPEAYKGNLEIDYAAIEIPNKFIVGYGLDYNGIGRNLKDIYQLKEG